MVTESIRPKFIRIKILNERFNEYLINDWAIINHTTKENNGNKIGLLKIITRDKKII
ncbi:MAG TPA: hypothetical protein HA271_07680 [Methanobacterium subterraneum]|jgi:hypothetical protein|uniref:Uncharacterized protein n=1 Tax=Methanobacterium subterraneum TaxID=59277 RepID=A0A7J4TKZ2_9EURY|nr:hypothetical protein [Methanobacterium subterraneum]